MRLGNTPFMITKTRTGEYWSNILGYWMKERNLDDHTALRQIYKVFKTKYYSDDAKIAYLTKAVEDLRNTANVRTVNEADNSAEVDQKVSVEDESVKIECLKSVLSKTIDFFKEFDFEPNFRFINTLSNQLIKSRTSAIEYIKSYFELTDNENYQSLVEKMKSQEFVQILDDLKKVAPTKIINKRLKIYYGSAGTGKTTQAVKESKYTIPCHSAMLPTDIMEDFAFDDGKAGFHKSMFWKAMEEGYTICMDEINLLPFESLRFLQNLLDGKKNITYKGINIEISDNFSVIGTMNLVVNNTVYSLPEPLVDRCSALKKFTLTADSLVGALI